MLAPRISVIFWGAMLDKAPSLLLKVKAAKELSQSELGCQYLYGAVSNRDTGVRELAVAELCSDRTPWEICQLLDSCRLPEDESSYKIILSTLDYQKYNRQVIDVLQYEYEHQTNAMLKADIQKVMEGFGRVRQRVSR
jgi:hypothetical protein